MNELIRTLVVDDSAFVRKFVREMLSRCPYIEVVGTARDGNEALELVEQLKPDVVTCDLVMPGCDGVAFVKEQMKRRPLPILILTSAPEDGERALEAMEAGAVDFVQKPTALASEEVLGSILVGKEELRYALMIHTRFRLRASDISGYLVMILGIVSLERLLTELQAWEEDQTQP